MPDNHNEKNKKSAEILAFDYRFTLANGEVKLFHLELDAETLSLRSPAAEPYPDWTRLTYQQCPNCPLREKDSPHCPVARNLVDIIDFFKNSISCDKARVEITSDTRTYSKETALQNGISSLIGLVMVTSGCPVMDKLKPMAKIHLPFASGEETLYRAVSMYLLAQYFTAKRGGKPDWDLTRLADFYEEVRVVNKSFCQRLSSTCVEDASLNAVIHLDCFANHAAMPMENNDLLKDFEKFFAPYF